MANLAESAAGKHQATALLASLHWPKAFDLRTRIHTVKQSIGIAIGVTAPYEAMQP